MSEMVIPEWAEETREQMLAAHGAIDYDKSGVTAVELIPVTNFSTHFAEFENKGGGILIHLFPRSGPEDRWYPSSVSDGKYKPSRREVDFGARFPDNISSLIKDAADACWHGSVAIELVSLLAYKEGLDIATEDPIENNTGVYAIQFQSAAIRDKVDLGQFVDNFCDTLDRLLEK